MKRYYYRDRQADGSQKVFDKGFKCGYQQGYRAGRAWLDKAMRKEMKIKLEQTGLSKDAGGAPSYYQGDGGGSGQTGLEECTPGNCPFAEGSGPWGMSPDGWAMAKIRHDKYHRNRDKDI